MFRLLLNKSFSIAEKFSKINTIINTKINNVQFMRFLQYKPIETSNVIRMGHKMTQVIEKKRHKYLEKKVQDEKYSNTFRQSRRLLIASWNPNFNHFTGQAYKNFSERNFASFGWKNRRSAGQYFTINAISSHPSLIDSSKVRNERGEMIEFEDTFLSPILIQKLKKIYQQPTLIQHLGIKQILSRQSHHLIVAETGGGKTLTYTLPAIECSIAIKKYLDKINIKRANNQPICIILVPTRELVFQIYKTFNQLISVDNVCPSEFEFDQNCYLKNLNVVVDLHEAQIKAKEQVTGIKLNSLNENKEKPIDIMITMPGQLEDRLDTRYFNSAYLRQVVLDEADTLLDDSFSRTTLKCLSLLRMNLEMAKLEPVMSHYEQESDPSELEALRRKQFNFDLQQNLKDPSVQLLFVSATVPRDLKNILIDLIDCESSLKSISTNKINRLMLHVPQKFIRTNGTKRSQQLLELIQKDLNNKNLKRTIMIFTYRAKTAVYVHKYLKENNIDCELLTKQLNNLQREQVVVRVLVCTDIASRGWDTIHVNHVVNFEMPQYIADYLHRVGRVGRINSHKHAGSAGLVTNFIINRFEVDLVWNIERSLRLETELHNVNANVKRLYKYSYLNEHGEIDQNQKLASLDKNNQHNHPKSQQSSEQDYMTRSTMVVDFKIVNSFKD
ncbi:putative ATP-dependent RNA helicase DDX28 [Brachionus plicatilis]|uniref:ATP-dependent RNA helicase n=1 Tax=Brachionus plicatilis TaxID=10195 RepID=A0A3M7QNM5_BRAPC|nr:putative ATP-dependent RNA helicase DDX28 [Brachionus plicatilis]